MSWCCKFFKVKKSRKERKKCQRSAMTAKLEITAGIKQQQSRAKMQSQCHANEGTSSLPQSVWVNLHRHMQRRCHNRGRLVSRPLKMPRPRLNCIAPAAIVK